jgi:Putative DNA-binding domain
VPSTPEPSLRALQLRVMDALLGADLDSASALVLGASAAATERLDVYRNNTLGNFRDALESSFPAVRRLVGEEYFRQTAREFQRRHPSTSGDLLHAGERFPQFLGELHGADRFSYLADVARLEWLVQEALLAGGHAPFDLGKLGAVDPEDYDALRFELHPSLRLFFSPFPALRIWETNVGPDADPQTDPEPVALDQGSDAVAILNPQLTLRLLRLGPGEAAFLHALQAGECFADAIAAGVAAAGVPGAGLPAAGGAFDATAALRRFVQTGAIVDFR